MDTVNTPIIIFGGGVAGLWTLNFLREKGHQAILVESKDLGGTQTLASQGMIHGGVRYSLQGKRSKHNDALKDMPKIWESCIAGHGEIDLSGTKLLSEEQHMWSPGGIGAGVTTFLASKSMEAEVEPISKEHWPEIFKSATSFKGKVFRMNEVVLDVKSLIQILSTKYTDSIYQAEIKDISTVEDSIKSITIASGEEEINISADHFVFAAGAGNEKIASKLGLGSEITQTRPLKQVMVKSVPFPLYAHCIKADPRPRVTISAHPNPDGTYCWYLGGLVAMHGLEHGDDAAISFAKSELASLFHWLDWKQMEWSVFDVDRAEPYTKNGLLPLGPTVRIHKNVALCWPTKLTSAPAVAHKVYDWVKESSKNETIPKLNFATPEIGSYPWEKATWRSA